MATDEKVKIPMMYDCLHFCVQFLFCFDFCTTIIYGVNLKNFPLVYDYSIVTM